MRDVRKFIYMLLFHPILFCKYSIRKKSRLFFVNGSSKHMKMKGVILGRHVRFGDRTRIASFGDCHLSIGNNCYFVNNNTFLIGEDINIGNNVTIASDVLITSENHEAHPEMMDVYGTLDMKPVKIGNFCWIAEKAIILPGVTIGDYSVIGGGAIVTKDIPAYSIAVGNPAKVIKQYNFSTHEWEKVKCPSRENI